MTTTQLVLIFFLAKSKLIVGSNSSDLWPDTAIAGVSDDLYLTHLRAAHIELLSMVVTKKCRGNLDIWMEASAFIKKYLDDHNAWMIKNLMELYNRALASPIDGVLAMANAIFRITALHRG